MIAPTANMRIRFIASDEGDGSVVEAGVDGVRIESIDCGAVPAVVTPANTNVFRGVLVAGSADDLAESDDAFAGFNPGFTITAQEAPVWLIFDSNLPTDDFEGLLLQYEAQADTPGLTATLEAFNWTSNSYDVVDTSATMFSTDAIVSVDLSANTSDYIMQGTAEVRSRLGWRRTGFTILFPWEARLDHVFWMANYGFAINHRLVLTGLFSCAGRSTDCKPIPCKKSELRKHPKKPHFRARPRQPFGFEQIFPRPRRIDFR